MQLCPSGHQPGRKHACWVSGVRVHLADVAPVRERQHAYMHSLLNGWCLCNGTIAQALIRQCVEEYMRRHEAGEGTPAELRDLGGRLVRRIQGGYKDVMHPHRVWLSTARCAGPGI